MTKRAKITTTTLEADGARVQTVTREMGGDEESEFEDGLSDSKSLQPTGLLDEAIPYEKLREDLVKPREECWGCVHKFCPQRRPGVNEVYDNLWNTYASNRDTVGSDRLANMIAKQWQSKVYNPSIEQGLACLYWPASMIKCHLMFHMDDHKTTLKDLIQQNKVFLYKMSDSVIVNKGGRPVADTEQVKNYTTLTKNMAQLIQLSQDIK
jgi:hypothetical protein